MDEEQRPKRIAPRIKAAPKIRQAYWCDFWQDAMVPEMWKTRPVIVISYRNTLFGTCLVVPTSSSPHDGDPWAHKLSIELENRPSWAVCTYLSTVSTSRLSQFNQGIPILPKADFNAILAILAKWLPRPFDIEI